MKKKMIPVLEKMAPLLVVAAVMIIVFFFLPAGHEDGEASQNNNGLPVLIAVALFVAVLLFTHKKSGSPSFGSIDLSGWVSFIRNALLIVLAIWMWKRGCGGNDSSNNPPQQTQTPISVPPATMTMPGPDLTWGDNVLTPEKRYYMNEKVAQYMYAADSAGYGATVYCFKEGQEETVHWEIVFQPTNGVGKMNHQSLVAQDNGKPGRFYFLVKKQITVRIQGKP